MALPAHEWSASVLPVSSLSHVIDSLGLGSSKVIVFDAQRQHGRKEGVDTTWAAWVVQAQKADVRRASLLQRTKHRVEFVRFYVTFLSCNLITLIIIYKRSFDASCCLS